MAALLTYRSSEDAAAAKDEAVQQLKHVHACNIGGGAGVVVFLGGFLPSHDPEEKLFQALPPSASSHHPQGEQGVWQNRTSALGLSQLWGGVSNLFHTMLKIKLCKRCRKELQMSTLLPPQLWPLPHLKRHHRFNKKLQLK